MPFAGEKFVKGNISYIQVYLIFVVSRIIACFVSKIKIDFFFINIWILNPDPDRIKNSL